MKRCYQQYTPAQLEALPLGTVVYWSKHSERGATWWIRGRACDWFRTVPIHTGRHEALPYRVSATRTHEQIAARPLYIEPWGGD